MAFNSYAIIEIKISKACNAIYNCWYVNCTQAVSTYNVPNFIYKDSGLEAR